MGRVTLTGVLMAVAYALIMSATIPALAEYDTFTFALVPVWLVLVGYSASIMKSLTPSEKSAKDLAHVAWLAWFTYYLLAIMLPLPMHWYDALVIMSLLISPENLVGSPLMAAYYVLSAATYLEQQDALQVSGRIILATVTAGGALQSLRGLQSST